MPPSSSEDPKAEPQWRGVAKAVVAVRRVFMMNFEVICIWDGIFVWVVIEL